MTCAIHTDQPATSFCRTCGKALCQSCQRDVRGVIYCQDCLAARLEGTVPPAAATMPTTVYVAPVSSASPGLAAALGFIPGVGAFYNGQFAKGFVHVFIFAVLAHLADRADFLGFLVAAWMFYMVFDAYTTAKARLLGQPLPDHLGLNALLASFGLGTPLTSVPQAAAAHAGAPPAANSGDVNPGISGFVPVDQAGTSASGSAQPYTADPGLLQRSCGPGGMPIGAIILIALGVLLLLDNLGVLSFRWTAQFWPVVLIVLGIWLAFRRMATVQGRNN
jgi:TM2 domain-containing membrane protein YozV